MITVFVDWAADDQAIELLQNLREGVQNAEAYNILTGAIIHLIVGIAGAFPLPAQRNNADLA